ncbi:MAG: helix-turn-helix transcriptional regulator [Fimbriimonadaceae bacterium]
MSPHDWRVGRERRGLTQVVAAERFGVSQAYLSQLERGSRVAGAALAEKAATFYGLATALPLPEPDAAVRVDSDRIEKDLASLGYPKFAHVAEGRPRNPAGVVFGALTQKDLDSRLVEALPWVLAEYVDLDWVWLRDQAKLRNAQNRLGYLVRLAREVTQSEEKVLVLTAREQELEEARLAREDTLCRESMPQRERTWLRTHRPAMAAHWNLLTSLTSRELPYASA